MFFTDGYADCPKKDIEAIQQIINNGVDLKLFI